MKTKYAVNFNQVLGQESAKRAIEVAMAGDHSLMLIGPHGFGKTMLTRAFLGAILDTDIEATIFESLPCPCGNYTSTILECYCDLQQLKSHKRKMHKTDMIVTCPEVEYKHIWNKTSGEHTDDIMERVIEARAFLPKVVRDSIPEDAKALLKHAYTALGLNLQQFHKVIDISCTIAAVELSESIRASHIAEALYYRIKDR
ncbi:MAG TPA: ATP-binding protein [Methanosarcinales archaeon]|nr:ATP-binding protein [Methanosarcinales archaeon]